MHQIGDVFGPVSLSEISAKSQQDLWFTYSTVKVWIDGIPVSGISPTPAQVQAQWATPQYLNLQLQLVTGYVATGASAGGFTATPMKIGYVRVFTQ
jgi:hypothetical protein